MNFKLSMGIMFAICEGNGTFGKGTYSSIFYYLCFVEDASKNILE